MGAEGLGTRAVLRRRTKTGRILGAFCEASGMGVMVSVCSVCNFFSLLACILESRTTRLESACCERTSERKKNYCSLPILASFLSALGEGERSNDSASDRKEYSSTPKVAALRFFVLPASAIAVTLHAFTLHPCMHACTLTRARSSIGVSGHLYLSCLLAPSTLRRPPAPHHLQLTD